MKATDSGRHFISGLASGVISAAALQPLDLLKTRVQQPGSSSLATTLRSLRESPHIIATLWRGTIPSTLRTGFGSGLYFASLHSLRRLLARAGDNTTVQSLKATKAESATALTTSKSANLVAGAAARTFAGFVLMPLTVIKVRFESTVYAYATMYAAACDIRQSNGIRGFFAGFGATAIRDAPYAGIYVLLYEVLKSRLSVMASLASGSAEERHRSTTSISSLVNFSSGILAGATCSAISNPFDAVKTRIQLRPHAYRNIWQAGCRMIAEDGLRSLWGGLALRMSRKALSSALAWTFYEEFVRRL